MSGAHSARTNLALFYDVEARTVANGEVVVRGGVVGAVVVQLVDKLVAASVFAAPPLVRVARRKRSLGHGSFTSNYRASAPHISFTSQCCPRRCSLC